MATAQPERSQEFERLTVGTKEDGGEEMMKIHSHFIALFALKAYLDSDVEDFKIWTLGKDEGISSYSKEVVCAYKTRDGTKEKGGWTYMIWPTVVQQCFKEPENTSQLMPMGKGFPNYFHTYKTLKMDLKLIRDFDKATAAIVFFNPGEEMIDSCKLLQKTKERDFLFKRELWKYRDDIGNTEEMVENIGEGISFLMNEKAVGGVRGKYSMEQLKSDVQEFVSKVSFATDNSILQDVKNTLETEIRICFPTSDCETIQRTLMEMINDLTEKNRVGCEEITDANVRVCFEGIRKGRDEGSKMKFNLRDPVSDFVGRGRELRQLLYFLGGTSSQWEVGPAKKVVVSGFGGVGKSELAKEYCRRHSSLYDNIAWIHAENEERIAASFRALATEKLGIKTKTTEGSFKDAVTVSKECFYLLKTRKTLVVLDNAESLQQIKKYLPGEATKGRLYIILTSRFQDWSDLSLIPLECFHPKEALNLVKGSLSHLPSWREDEGQRLCKTLGYYPLVLKQAVSYILAQHDLSQKDGATYLMNEYLQGMESQAEVLLDRPITRGNNAEYGETTYKVMLTTWQHLKKSLSGQMAITILNIMSYLSPDCIDVDRMCDANPKYSKDVILKSFSVLAKLSVITFDSKSLRIHRMVQLLNRMKLRNSEHEVSVLREAMLFANTLGVQHMVSVWEYAVKYETLVREYSSLPVKIIDTLHKEGMHDLHLHFSLRAEETLKNTLGSHHPDTLKVMRLSSHSYQYLGNTTKATEKIKECLDAYREFPEGCRSPDYFWALFDFSTLLESSLKYDQYISVLQAIMSDGPPVLGENSNLIHVVRSKFNIISSLWPDSNEIEDIIKSGNRTVRIGNFNSQSRGLPESFEEMGNNGQSLQNTIGDVVHSARDQDHFCEKLVVKWNKALSLHSCGKIREALEEVKAVYKDSKNRMGEDHVFSLKCKIFLGIILFDMGKVVEAEKELDEVCSRMGPSCRDHNLRVSTLSLRAKILCAHGKTEEAIPHILASCRNESLDSIYSAGLMCAMSVLTYAENGGKHKFVARVMKKIFHAINDCGGRKEVPKMFLELSSGLGVALSEQGLKKQALVILKEVYQCYKLVNGERHVETLEVKLVFASICCSFGDGDTFNKGLGYLSEIRRTLSTVEDVGDLRIKKLYEATKNY